MSGLVVAPSDSDSIIYREQSQSDDTQHLMTSWRYDKYVLYLSSLLFGSTLHDNCFIHRVGAAKKVEVL